MKLKTVKQCEKLGFSMNFKVMKSLDIMCDVWFDGNIYLGRIRDGDDRFIDFCNSYIKLMNILQVKK